MWGTQYDAQIHVSHFAAGGGGGLSVMAAHMCYNVVLCLRDDCRRQ